MTTRYEQLQEFNEAGENHEINREHLRFWSNPRPKAKPVAAKISKCSRSWGATVSGRRPAGTTDRTMIAAARLHATI